MPHTSSVYVKHFADITVLYGTIATVGLLLLWIYFAALILLAGGFINKLLEDRRHKEGDAAAIVTCDAGAIDPDRLTGKESHGRIG